MHIRKASDRKRKANIANSRKSTGPRTAEGKAQSRLNAVKHGLTASTVVLPTEDGAEFEALRDALLEELVPQGALEMILAERIIMAAWRLRRAAAFEPMLVNVRTEYRWDYRESDRWQLGAKDLQQRRQDMVDGAERSIYWCLEEGKYEKVTRYEAHMNRTLYQALEMLRRFQERRWTAASHAAPSAQVLLTQMPMRTRTLTPTCAAAEAPPTEPAPAPATADEIQNEGAPPPADDDVRDEAAPMPRTRGLPQTRHTASGRPAASSPCQPAHVPNEATLPPAADDDVRDEAALPAAAALVGGGPGQVRDEATPPAAAPEGGGPDQVRNEATQAAGDDVRNEATVAPVPAPAAAPPAPARPAKVGLLARRGIDNWWHR